MGVESLLKIIKNELTKQVIDLSVLHDDIILQTSPEHILSVLKFLRDNSDCQFRQLIDICGVDYLGRSVRFEVVYHLLSMHKNQRIRVKLSCDEEASVPTATNLFKSANWFEREAFDLYGILFSGHHDLRRLLTDYGFEGHPLRKDFPLSGHVETRWDDKKKQVVYEAVQLQQNYREFDFLSPWEGVTNAEKEGE